MIETLTSFLTHQIQNIGQWAYMLAFFAALLETIIGIGMVTPGSTIILFLGGYTALTGNLDFFDLVFFAATGAIFGDNINYSLGKKFGEKWQKNGFWIVKPEHFRMGHMFFQKHGGKSVFLGRFVPMVKEMTPFVAGSLHMKWRTFFFFNVFGGIGWAFEFLGLGFLFAGSLVLAEAWLGRIAFFIFALLLFLLFLSFLQWSLTKYGKQVFAYFLRIFVFLRQSFFQINGVKKYIKNHPKIILFIHNRFSSHSFFGFPLTILSVIFFYFFFGYLGMVEDFVSGDIIIQIDTRLENLLFLFRDSTLFHIFLWITALGKSEVILSFLLISSVILWLLQKKPAILSLWISVVGAGGIVYLSKLFFDRPRPELALYIEHTPSFPSAHATIAVAFYGFLAWMIMRNVSGWKAKIHIFFVTLILILLIGFSRLYLGVHYLSDVLAGYFVGGMMLVFSIALLEYWKSTHHKKTVFLPPSKKTYIGFLLLLSLLLYLFFGYQFQSTLPIQNISLSQKTKNIQTLPEAFVDSHLKYTETITGRETEPINFIFLTPNSQNIEDIFARAGWRKSDRLGIVSSGKMLDNIFGSRSYETAPITPLFWNGRTQDFSFQKLPEVNSIKIRHHIRIWETNFLLHNEKVFVGSAIFDDGIKWGITHKISADIDNEREVVFEDLESTGKVLSSEKIPFVPPVSGENFSGDFFVTDGNIYVLKF